MNLKKLALPEQFLLPRKVLSGFAFGIGVTITVLALLMLNNSLGGPSVEPTIQGFQSVRQGRVLNETQVEDASQVAVAGQASVSGKSQWRNFTEQLKNGSFTAEVNRSVENDEGVSVDLDGVVKAVEKTPLANVSEVVKNGGFTGEAVRVVGNVNISGRAVVGMNPGVEGNKVRENNNVSDILYNAELGNSIRGEEKASVANRVGNSTENDKNITSMSSSQLKKTQSDSYEKCDIFDGKWVKDDSKPYYPPGSCPYIDKDFDCHLNGRPDDGYIKWKWQPKGCDIPR